MDIINLDGKEIKLEIIKKNNKNIYFRFKDDLVLYVTCNKFVSKAKIFNLIKENQKQILKMYESQKKIIKNANEFYYLGDKYDIIYTQVDEVKFSKNIIYVRDNKMLNEFLNKQTKKIFTNRVEAISLMFDYLPEFKLRIRNMKTRWGVCNRTNNVVTLNSQLIRKETSLLDYVIIHEFCHFKHPNHSKAFWQEVSKYYPYYKMARQKLKDA